MFGSLDSFKKNNVSGASREPIYSILRQVTLIHIELIYSVLLLPICQSQPPQRLLHHERNDGTCLLLAPQSSAARTRCKLIEHNTGATCKPQGESTTGVAAQAACREQRTSSLGSYCRPLPAALRGSRGRAPWRGAAELTPAASSPIRQWCGAASLSSISSSSSCVIRCCPAAPSSSLGAMEASSSGPDLAACGGRARNRGAGGIMVASSRWRGECEAEGNRWRE
jgi:hypothetical protein